MNITRRACGVVVGIGLLAVACGSGDRAIELTAAAAPASTAEAVDDRVTVTGTAVVVHDRFDTLGEVRNGDGEVPVAGDELLWARNSSSDGRLVELVDAAGLQMTLGQWTQADATASAECVPAGTRFTMEFTGLVPDGVYTLWEHLTSRPIEPDFGATAVEPRAAIMASGSLAAAPFDAGTVVADASGSASVDLVSPAGEMTMAGSRGACVLTDVDTVLLVLNYHLDGRTYGPFPGPDSVDAGHMHLFFQRADVER